jgi:hypothetical protein
LTCLSIRMALVLAWLAVVLSIGSIGLLYWVIRGSAATSVPVLSGAGGDLRHGLSAVRRTTRWRRDRRHRGLRRRGVLVYRRAAT